MGKTYEEALEAIISILKGIYNNRAIPFNENNEELNVEFNNVLYTKGMNYGSFKNHEFYFDHESYLGVIIKYSEYDNIDVIFARLVEGEYRYTDEFRADPELVDSALREFFKRHGSPMRTCELIFSKNIRVEKHFHEALDKYNMDGFYYKGLAYDEDTRKVNDIIYKSIKNTVSILDTPDALILKTKLTDVNSVEFTFTLKDNNLRVRKVNYIDETNDTILPLAISRDLITKLLFDFIVKTKFYDNYAEHNNGFILNFSS